MKSVSSFLVLAFILGACSSPKKSTSTKEGTSAQITNSGAVQDGSSFENAIIIKQKRERSGIDAEYKWLDQNYPGYTRIKQSLTHRGKKHYDILKIKTKDGEEKDIYFDITNFFGKW